MTYSNSLLLWSIGGGSKGGIGLQLFWNQEGGPSEFRHSPWQTSYWSNLSISVVQHIWPTHLKPWLLYDSCPFSSHAALKTLPVTIFILCYYILGPFLRDLLLFEREGGILFSSIHCWRYKVLVLYAGISLLHAGLFMPYIRDVKLTWPCGLNEWPWALDLHPVESGCCGRFSPCTARPSLWCSRSLRHMGWTWRCRHHRGILFSPHSTPCAVCSGKSILHTVGTAWPLLAWGPCAEKSLRLASAAQGWTSYMHCMQHGAHTPCSTQLNDNAWSVCPLLALCAVCSAHSLSIPCPLYTMCQPWGSMCMQPPGPAQSMRSLQYMG